jgi:sec-independent protein translocase protein TatA
MRVPHRAIARRPLGRALFAVRGGAMAALYFALGLISRILILELAMGSLGVPELIVIFVIALIFFGPKKLPELGRSLGKSINEFKKASNELRSTLDEEIRIDDQRQKQASTPPAPAINDPSAPMRLPAPGETVARGEHGS